MANNFELPQVPDVTDPHEVANAFSGLITAAHLTHQSVCELRKVSDGNNKQIQDLARVQTVQDGMLDKTNEQIEKNAAAIKELSGAINTVHSSMQAHYVRKEDCNHRADRIDRADEAISKDLNDLKTEFGGTTRKIIMWVVGTFLVALGVGSGIIFGVIEIAKWLGG